ncbi:MAG: DnaJ C-terminal domain-containing protein [Phycisphaerales bacterium]
MVTVCSACRGRGKIIKDKCPTCHGKGRSPKSWHPLRQDPRRHPRRTGRPHRRRGRASPGPDLRPTATASAATHVIARVKAHKVFQREGDHLLLEMPISFTQATLGATVDVPTLEGKRELNIPRGTQYGALFRVSGAGLPNLRSGSRGDLVVVIKIETPKKLSAKQEDLLRAFAETEDKDVNPESAGFWKKITDFLGKQ